MKKSNKIIFGALGAVFIFSIAFQLKVNQYLRNPEPNKETIASISEERSVTSFSKISVSDGIEVFFTQDSITNIKVEGSKSDIANIITDLKKGELFIKRIEETKNANVARVFVHNNQLNALKASSGAYFETMGKVTGDEIILEFSSDTKANLELSYNSVKCKAASGSQIKFKGNTSNIEFTN